MSLWLLRLGYCVRVCPFDAISMGDNGLPVIDQELCTGCNKCRDACPKGVIRMTPDFTPVLVACNSHAKGAEVLKACKVGCIACGKCQGLSCRRHFYGGQSSDNRSPQMHRLRSLYRGLSHKCNCEGLKLGRRLSLTGATSSSLYWGDVP